MEIYPFSGVKENVDTRNMDDLGHHAEQKKPDMEECELHGSIFLDF